MRIRGHKVLVTGGSSGIGLAIARHLQPENEVIIAGRDESKLAAAVAVTPELRSHILDVGNEELARPQFVSIVEQLGGLSLLVNCAGIVAGYPLDAPNAGELAERDAGINFLGSLRMARLALPILSRAEGGGALVLISSVMAIAPAPGFAVYSATKAAVHSLARSMRRELKDRVRVFDVLPTWVETPPVAKLSISKLAPDAVATALVHAIARDQYDVYVGQAGAVALINRLSPALADFLVARATRSR